MERKWFGWKSEKGKFPVSRVIWNLLWLLPLYAVGGVFVLLVCCQSGLSAGRRAYRELLS